MGQASPGPNPTRPAVGVVVAAFPFLVLVGYALTRLTDRSFLLHRKRVRGLIWLGWLAAGAVMGLLPYSQMGPSSACAAGRPGRLPASCTGWT